MKGEKKEVSEVRFNASLLWQLDPKPRVGYTFYCRPPILKIFDLSLSQVTSQKFQRLSKGKFVGLTF